MTAVPCTYLLGRGLAAVRHLCVRAWHLVLGVDSRDVKPEKIPGYIKHSSAGFRQPLPPVPMATASWPEAPRSRS